MYQKQQRKTKVFHVVFWNYSYTDSPNTRTPDSELFNHSLLNAQHAQNYLHLLQSLQ